MGDLYNRRKRKDGGHGDQKSGTQIEVPKTSEIVAEEVGTSRATVERAGEFAYALDVIREKAGDVVL